MIVLHLRMCILYFVYPPPPLTDIALASDFYEYVFSIYSCGYLQMQVQRVPSTGLPQLQSRPMLRLPLLLLLLRIFLVIFIVVVVPHSAPATDGFFCFCFPHHPHPNSTSRVAAVGSFAGARGWADGVPKLPRSVPGRVVPSLVIL